ncbi:MAG: bifunctional glutamine-synthetase adenylyltransferase/deadenyltransferase, partial [Nocardioides sp.]
MTPRSDSVHARLLRLGFEDPDRARDELAALGDGVEPLVALLARTADPDQALSGLTRLAGRVGPELVSELSEDEGTSMRLLSVLGASQALADHLYRHPDQWRELADPFLGSTRPAAYAVRAGLLRAVGADPDVESPVATRSDGTALEALRVEYRRLLTRLAARDLAHHLG